MSLKKLDETGRVDVRVVPNGSLSDAALCFAFDANYLTPFKVMLLSMAQAGALTENPIVVCSDDPLVFQDPIVKLVVDRGVLLEGPLREKLYALAEFSVQRPERASWNRGTFLKWAAFDDYGFDAILFLDVDMLVLKPLGDLGAWKADVDIVACPQFRPTLYRRKGGGKLPEPAIERNLDCMVRGDFHRVQHRRLNSGVMLFGRSLANPVFREELIAFAAERTDLHEQGHLTEYFTRTRTRTLRLAPSIYNFQERYLGTVDPGRGLDLLGQIAILHYAGRKPWQCDLEPSSRISTLLWWNYHRAAVDAGLL